MNTKVRTWGNSLGIRIPRPFAREVKLRDGTPVDLKVDRGCLVIRPTGPRAANLAALVRRITPKNRQRAVDWGRPVGREVW